MKLIDVCDFQGGSQPPKEEWLLEEKNGYIRMLQIRDFTQSDRVIPEYVKISSTIKTCEADDVLIARYGASLGKILTGLAGAYNVAIMRTIPDTTKLRKKYLYYYLRSSYFQNGILNVGGRAAQAGFNKEDLSKLEIQCPPFSEQDSIIENLERTERIIEYRQQEHQKLNTLIKARFVEMFGDHYQEDTLLNLCNIIDYRGKTPEKTEDGLPFITAKNVRMHQMSLEPREYISKETYDKVMVRGFPKEGDVVFTTEAPLGNVCRIPHFNTDFYIGQRIVTLQTEKLNPTYLEYALSTEEFKRKYMGKSSGSTVTGIRVRLLEQLTIPVPPHDLQNQFADFVAQVDKSKSVVQQVLAKDQLLFDSLMQQYFG